jgi:hypothetical protein
MNKTNLSSSTRYNFAEGGCWCCKHNHNYPLPVPNGGSAFCGKCSQDECKSLSSSTDCPVCECHCHTFIKEDHWSEDLCEIQSCQHCDTTTQGDDSPVGCKFNPCECSYGGLWCYVHNRHKEDCDKLSGNPGKLKDINVPKSGDDSTPTIDKNNLINEKDKETKILDTKPDTGFTALDSNQNNGITENAIPKKTGEMDDSKQVNNTLSTGKASPVERVSKEKHPTGDGSNSAIKIEANRASINAGKPQGSATGNKQNNNDSTEPTKLVETSSKLGDDSMKEQLEMMKFRCPNYPLPHNLSSMEIDRILALFQSQESKTLERVREKVLDKRVNNDSSCMDCTEYIKALNDVLAILEAEQKGKSNE